MAIKFETVETRVTQLIEAQDRLIIAICAELKYPLDEGNRAQTLTRRSDYKEALVKLLMCVDLIE